MGGMLATRFALMYPQIVTKLILEDPLGLEDYKKFIPLQPIEALYKNEMKAEYLYFWADTFFSWKEGEFEEFAAMYEDIKLPFWCQTRVETVTYERFKRLKDIGCARISFGLEHGNEKFRKEVVRRPYSNDILVKNFKIYENAMRYD